MIDEPVRDYLLRASEQLRRGTSYINATGSEAIMARRIWTGLFWVDATERAIGTAASGALATIGTGAIGILDVAWPTVGSVAGLAAVVSLLVSLVAGTTGDSTTAGFTTGTR